MSFLSSADLPSLSFRYDGRPSQELLPAWKKAISDAETPDARVTRVSYLESPAGLEVTATVRRFTDFPAVEWVVELENHGPADTPIIEEILPLDISVPISPQERLRLHHANGSLCQMDDFLPQLAELRPGSQQGAGPARRPLIQRRVPLHEPATRRLRAGAGDRVVGSVACIVRARTGGSALGRRHGAHPPAPPARREDPHPAHPAAGLGRGRHGGGQQPAAPFAAGPLPAAAGRPVGPAALSAVPRSSTSTSPTRRASSMR